MIIEQYGVKLKRVEFEDIELIRKWRNHPDIRKNMMFKKHITKSMQEDWFHSINNPFNYYFLIEYRGTDIGVINCKNVNTIDGYGEGGIFIWKNNEKDEFAPVLASLCLLNAIFMVLNIYNKSFVRIVKTNRKAINFNKSLGYILLPNQEQLKAQFYLLTKEDYLKKTKKLNSIAAKLSGNNELKVYGKPSDNNALEINSILTSKQETFRF